MEESTTTSSWSYTRPYFFPNLYDFSSSVQKKNLQKHWFHSWLLITLVCYTSNLIKNLGALKFLFDKCLHAIYMLIHEKMFSNMSSVVSVLMAYCWNSHVPSFLAAHTCMCVFVYRMSSEDKSLEPCDQGPSPPPSSAGSPAPSDKRLRGRSRNDAAPSSTPKSKRK